MFDRFKISAAHGGNIARREAPRFILNLIALGVAVQTFMFRYANVRVAD
jgi:hypothetical protein